MAIQRNVTAADHVFLGEDKILRYKIWEDHEKTIPINVAAWELIWVLRKTDKAEDPALIVKANTDSPPGIAVIGVFNADPLVNTQEVEVTLLDTDSYDPTVSPAVKLKRAKYRYSLKRMDDGAETILTFGDFQFLQATAR